MKSNRSTQLHSSLIKFSISISSDIYRTKKFACCRWLKLMKRIFYSTRSVFSDIFAVLKFHFFSHGKFPFLISNQNIDSRDFNNNSLEQRTLVFHPLAIMTIQNSRHLFQMKSFRCFLNIDIHFLFFPQDSIKKTAHYHQVFDWISTQTLTVRYRWARRRLHVNIYFIFYLIENEMKHSCHALLRLLEEENDHHQACRIRLKKQRERITSCMPVFSSEYHSLIQHISSYIHRR